MFIPHGYASTEYISAEPDKSLHLNKPLILILHEPIKEIKDIINIMEYIKSIERPLVIYSPEIKKEPLSVLLYNQRKMGLNVK